MSRVRPNFSIDFKEDVPRLTPAELRTSDCARNLESPHADRSVRRWGRFKRPGWGAAYLPCNFCEDSHLLTLKISNYHI